MRIGVIVPLSARTEEELDERRDYLKRVCDRDTEIVMVKVDEGPVSLESELGHEEASVQIAKKMIQLQNEGFDAFIPFCGGDPGLIAARERISIPVIGPFQSSCSIASLLGFKFSIVSPMPSPRLTELRLQEIGLLGRLASIRKIGIPLIELRKDISKTLATLEKVCEKAVTEDGADVIMFNCLSLFGMAESLRGRVAVPIVDAGWASVRMAETVVRLGLSHSPLAYPYTKF